MSFSPTDLELKNFGVYITKVVPASLVDNYMVDKLDLKNHIDYEFVTNAKLDGKLVGVLFLMSNLGIGRWVSSLGYLPKSMRHFDVTSTDALRDEHYELFGG
jgi:hypothetical protein